MQQLQLFADLKGKSLAGVNFHLPNKALFFDRDDVKRQLSPAKRKALSKIGAYIRRDAKGLIRKPRMKRVADLTDSERANFEAEKQARRDARTRLKDPGEIVVVRNGKPLRINYRSATTAERRKYRISQSYYANSTVKRPPMPSEPGTAPRNVTGRLRDNIFFSFDPSTESVVIGPQRLSAAAPRVPEILEYGGETELTYGPDAGQKVTVKPRPYMHPAYAMNLDTVDAEFHELRLMQ